MAAEEQRQLKWERKVVARAQRGESTAFGEIYDAYAPVLYRKILLPRLGCVEAAEDALAETFRTAIEKLGEYEQRDVSIYRWLSRVAHNKAMDMLRARTKTGRRVANMQSLLDPLCAPQDGADRLLELAVDAEELPRRVGAALAELNPRYRRCIELRIFEEKDRETCAAELDVKVGTFDVLLHRAFQAFRKRWNASLESREESRHVGPTGTAA